LNTAGQAKTAEHIASVCSDLMEQIHTLCPQVSFAGFVMNSAAANRAAMDMLDQQRLQLQQPALVNLQCCSHTLSLLLKDLYKRLKWVRDVFDGAMLISAATNSNESLRYMFKQQVLVSNSAATTIASHSETQFGSQYLVLKSCVK
jgi:adenosine/AMP kinase